MATVRHLVTTPSTTNGTSYASGSFTPDANELLVALVSAVNTIRTDTTMTDSQSLTFARVDTKFRAASLSIMVPFVANALAANSSMTVTFDCTGDAAGGTVITVLGVTGMTKDGLDAILQYAAQENQAAGTPAPAFSSSALTGNPTIGFVCNATDPAGLTEPSGWTERADSGHGSPTHGMEVVSRDSGFTGTTITWGSASASDFGSFILELDSSGGAAPTIPPKNVIISQAVKRANL